MRDRIRVNGVLYKAVGNYLDESLWHKFDFNDYGIYDVDRLPGDEDPLIFTSKAGIDVILSGGDNRYPGSYSIDIICPNELFGSIEYHKEYVNKDKEEILRTYEEIINKVRKIPNVDYSSQEELGKLAKSFGMI